MMVNPFWFGVLVAFFAILLLMFILALISSKRSDDDWEEFEPTEDEFREALESMTDKKFRIVRKNGYMIGEILEDDDNESEDH